MKILLKEKITEYLSRLSCDAEVLCFETLPSTNTYAKELAKCREIDVPILVTAYEQTAGKGTRGRSFVSPGGRGIYMSILFRPDPQSRPADITMRAAVSAARAIESLAPIKVGIKWVNDLYSGGRKLAGILTEGEYDDGKLNYAVMGIGVNLYGEDMPSEIADVATSVERECGAAIEAEKLVARITAAFLSGTDVTAEYRARSIVIGKEVTVSAGDIKRDAVVVDICDTGAVLLRFEDGKTQEIQSGDISLKIKHGGNEN